MNNYKIDFLSLKKRVDIYQTRVRLLFKLYHYDIFKKNKFLAKYNS